MNTTACDRIVRATSDEVVHITGLSNSQRWGMEAEGTFPKRFKLTPRGGRYGAAGYRLSDLEAWLDSLAEGAAAQ